MVSRLGATHKERNSPGFPYSAADQRAGSYRGQRCLGREVSCARVATRGAVQGSCTSRSREAPSGGIRYDAVPRGRTRRSRRAHRRARGSSHAGGGGAGPGHEDGGWCERAATPSTVRACGRQRSSLRYVHVFRGRVERRRVRYSTVLRRTTRRARYASTRSASSRGEARNTLSGGRCAVHSSHPPVLLHTRREDGLSENWVA
ncbi:hypothetical protein C2E23DRAFT_265592 [Lenzites betulinus]|nr:hypothetical protein C2E23DRAFT_265592 [Lenzites betulinus]